MQIKRTIQLGPICLRELSDGWWLGKYSRTGHIVSCFAPDKEKALKNLQSFAGVPRRWQLPRNTSEVR
jgi:hypothetical protein